MDPFEGFDRLDLFIETVLNENPLESLIENLLEEALPFNFQFSLEKPTSLSAL